MTEQGCAASTPEVAAGGKSSEETAQPAVSSDAITSSSGSSSSGRVVLTDSEQGALTGAEWAQKWQLQDAYIGGVEALCAQQEGELSSLRQQNERIRGQLSEGQLREKQFVRRLAAKEQEMQDYVCQVGELKASQAPTTASLRATLLDPAVNSLVQLLRAELQRTKAKLEETQNDLSAWKFTPDSNTGKRLMAKCRLLYQENEELGKTTSSGRIAILEGDLALQKKFTEEVRQSQLELDAFLADLDEDVEGMQSTIMFLQQELRRAKELVGQLQQENAALRAADGASNNGLPIAVAAEVEEVMAVAGLAEEEVEEEKVTAAAVDDDTDAPCQRANGDARSACVDDESGERTTRLKRVRRSSVLSIDYNDEDMCNTNGDNSMVSDAE